MQTHSIQQHVSLGPVHPGWHAQQEAFCIKSNEKQVHCLHLTNIFHRPDITFPFWVWHVGFGDMQTKPLRGQSCFSY